MSRLSEDAPAAKKKLGVDTIVHDEKYQEYDDRKLLNAFDAKYPELKVSINEERLDRMSEVCRRVHGKEFAEKCLKKIKDQGYINWAQRYFGLHYPADVMPEGNRNFMKAFEDLGFNWFREFEFFTESK